MEDYRVLGSRYLTTNKKRSLITVIGCFIVAAGLFMLLNCLACWVEKCREDARKDDDCEIVILTDDKDIIEKITNEEFVTSAYLGKAYSWQDDDTEEIYANTLHINVKEKFLINHYSKYIKKTYGVETELNDLLAWTYCQDNEGIGYLMILFGILISFILAIIGVGVLRNNISISAMERVKDYGNLRCIGATKKQIKQIVYRESIFLETIGIAAGIIAGFLLSIPVCISPKRQYPIGFHILPVVFLLIAFYGDMYFAVDDGLKKVLSVSPSEAVKGNYRIKARKVKIRRSGIWSILFGVEGDYAYKNIKRNKSMEIKENLNEKNLLENYKSLNSEVEKFENKYKRLKKDSCERKKKIKQLLMGNRISSEKIKSIKEQINNINNTKPTQFDYVNKNNINIIKESHNISQNRDYNINKNINNSQNRNETTLIYELNIDNI